MKQNNQDIISVFYKEEEEYNNNPLDVHTSFIQSTDEEYTYLQLEFSIIHSTLELRKEKNWLGMMVSRYYINSDTKFYDDYTGYIFKYNDLLFNKSKIIDDIVKKLDDIKTNQ